MCEQEKIVKIDISLDCSISLLGLEITLVQLHVITSQGRRNNICNLYKVILESKSINTIY
jgi:hypothetical protein